ncbi:NAD-dependent epimerase/dehydratase family protein [bacterium]|nr:MAG: NAD-dependent epimerase/dehydratase family protein [bacterium]
MAPRRVLVTGAGGYLAAALVPMLRRRLPRARLTLAARRPRPGLRAADLADPAAARKLVERARPDLVFHLAGGRGASEPGALWRDHVAAVLNVGAALVRAAPGARLVVAGSCAEYGAPPPGAVSEGVPPAPAAAYGRAKRAQTLAALSFAAEGLDVRVARLFNLSGPGTPESLAPGAFAAQAARLERAGGGVIRVGDLRPTRDYLDVRDAAEALLLLGLRGTPGAYNVCSGRAVPMSEVLRLVFAAARAPMKAVRDPARLRAAEVRGIVGSHARLTRETGWRPRTPLARSLEDTLAWHRSR